MNSINDIWEEVLRLLSAKLTPITISTWIEQCTPVDWDDMKLVLYTKNDFIRNIVQTRFMKDIKPVLYDLFSCDCEVLILAGEDELANYNERKNPSKPGDILPEMEDYTFDRFIVGNSNRFAHAASMAVAENPGSRDYNPLFIYGNSGLGKTHLLFSIGHTIHEKFPNKRISYIKGDDFLNRLIDSVQKKKMQDFHNEFRNVDLLLVDDIQFIAGKQQTQEEFFHTFNAIYEAGNQIVITSDRPPKEMSLLDDRLRTRFEGGMMADVQPPDFETRMAIVRNKAAQLGLLLPDTVVERIATKITANIRQLEGVIKKLSAYRDIINEDITTESVDRAIHDITIIDQTIPTPKKIIDETAHYFSLTDDDIRGQNRSKQPSEARQIAMYLMRTLTNLSLNDIGEEFDHRNHTTVLSSIRKVESSITKNDQDIVIKIRDISSNVNASN